MSGRMKQGTVVGNYKHSKPNEMEHSEGSETLMVAMQPTVDVEEVQIAPGGDSSMIEVQEVVVVTDDLENEQANLKSIDLSSGHLVPIGESEVPEVIRIHGSRLSDIKEPVGPSRGRPSVTSSEEDSEESESDSGYYRNRRTPKKREFAHRLQWRGKDMLEAMKSVEDRKMTIRGAAKKYNVPYSTLKDRVHGRVRHGTKPGVKTILSPEEEDELVRYVKDMEHAGFQLRHVDVRDRAGELLRLNHGHNTPYKDGSPGHNWLGGFLKRHPGLEFKRSLSRHTIPSAAKQKQMLRKFYDVSSQIFKKHRLHHKSERIFVVSEFRMRVSQHATVLIASSADGVVLPPFVVFHGQRLKLSSARQAFPEAFFTCSFNGYVNEDIFLWWFRDHFLKKINPSVSRPIVLFLSRPVTDISLQLAQRAKEERVYLIGIPTPVTHLVNPLDDELGQNIEVLMTKKANKWQEENENYPFTQRVFADILRKVWKKGITSDEITTKFAQNGLFPLNNGAISADRILNATQLLREAQQRAVAATPIKNDPLAGLSLLSALSSHEYASLGHMYNSNENLDRSFDPDDADARAEIETPVRASPRKSKRRRLDDYVTEEIQPPDRKRIYEEPVHSDEESNSRKGFQVSEELVKQVLEHNQKHKGRRSTKSHSSKQAERPGVQNEIAAARENIEQINRAIDSILEKAAKDEAKKSVDVVMPKGSVNDLIHGIKSDGEMELEEEGVVMEEIVPQEVVEEEVVEEQEVPSSDSAAVKIEHMPTLSQQTHEEVEVPVPPPIADTQPFTINQLLQNKRTILVETVVINGQKVKIVRMAPAQSASTPATTTISLPSMSSSTNNKSNSSSNTHPSPKITIVRAPRNKAISQPAELPVALHDIETEEVPNEMHAHSRMLPDPSQADAMHQMSHQQLLTQHERIEMAEDSGEVVELEGEHYFPEQATHHGVVTSEELSAMQTDQVQQPHMMATPQGMPMQIFEQEEVSTEVHDQMVIGEPIMTEQVVHGEQVVDEEQVVDSEQVIHEEHMVPGEQVVHEEDVVQGEQQVMHGEQVVDGEHIMAGDGIKEEHYVKEEGDGVAIEEEVITQQVFEDQNGVRYIQVYDPATGQHQLVMEEHVVY